MRLTVVDVAQSSPEWFMARLGKLTGSTAAAMLSAPRDRKGETAGRRNLRVQLVLERLMGRPMEDAGFKSKAMEQGTEREADAAGVYEALTGVFLTPTGFIAHESLQAGCSLDGHVGDFEGLIEIKSPIPATHLEYLRNGKVPADYHSQIVHNLWITGAKWCDWMSYQPNFPESLQVKLVRVERNEAEIKSYELMARLFLSEVDAEVEAVAEMARRAVA